MLCSLKSMQQRRLAQFLMHLESKKRGGGGKRRALVPLSPWERRSGSEAAHSPSPTGSSPKRKERFHSLQMQVRTALGQEPDEESGHQ